MKLKNLLLVVLVALMMGACARSGAVEVGESAPDFTLTDTGDQKVNLSDFNGKVVILDFFASWCPPCRQEIPDFVALEKEYGDKGFSMVGVSLVSKEETKSFAQEFGINYPVAIDDGKASAAYGPIRSIPTTFVLDKDHKVVKKYIGYRPKDVFEKDIKELL